MYVFIVFVAFAMTVLMRSLNADVIVYTQISNQIAEEFRDLPARFGAPIPLSGMRVLAVESEPKDGCGNIAPPLKNQNNNNKWVVIIRRYNCSFEDKVRHAQTAGYSAAIIYNIGSDDLEQMSANNDEGIIIPSVFVGEKTGKLIIYNYVTEDYVLVINDDLPFNINTHLILPFTIVVGLCFLIMIGFMIVKCVREQRRLRRHRLPGSALKKIPCIRFSKGQQSESYDTCAICLDDYVEGDKLRILPCSHAYHCKCIDPWLTKNRRVCPVCKRKVFARGESRRRVRRSSDDSMTDSDADDTTPLLNPVDHTNQTNHGTFPRPPSGVISGAATGSSSSDQTVGPPPRQNPFDRPVAEEQPDTIFLISNVWQRFLRIFNRSSSQHMRLLTHEDSSSSDVEQNQVAIHNEQYTSRPSSSSNNILNQNLSGSFREPRSLDNRDSNEGENGSAHTTVYSPTVPTQPPWCNSTQYQPLSNSRLGVAAIPNQNFNQMCDVPQGDGLERPISQGRRNQRSRGDSQRPPASSQQYFV